jgi:hypothetical protein
MTSQWRYRNNAKLELIEPDPEYPAEDVYLAGFLTRYGARIHHVTVKVPDLDQAVNTLRRAGVEPIDINKEPLFHEAFVRPADIGGLLVQLLWTEVADHQWENDLDLEVTQPPDNGARLLAVRLRHPAPDRAIGVWTTLGASADRIDLGLVARWPESPLEIRLEKGQPAGPVCLVFGSSPSLPTHPLIGPAVESQG